MPSEEPNPKFLRIEKVCEITAIPKSSIYAMMAAGEFPRQKSVSANRVVWLEADVIGWMRERIEAAKPKRLPRRRA